MNKFNNRTNRTSPWMIVQLKPNEVFVFGSNVNGYHGGV